MAFRFRRSVKVAPGLRLNFSKSGVSASAGVRGASVTAGKSGIHGNVGIPGTGLSYRERLDKPKSKSKASARKEPQVTDTTKSDLAAANARIAELEAELGKKPVMDLAPLDEEPVANDVPPLSAEPRPQAAPAVKPRCFEGYLSGKTPRGRASFVIGWLASMSLIFGYTIAHLIFFGTDTPGGLATLGFVVVSLVMLWMQSVLHAQRLIDIGLSPGLAWLVFIGALIGATALLIPWALLVLSLGLAFLPPKTEA